jgi:hypothetical protein
MRLLQGPRRVVVPPVLVALVVMVAIVSAGVAGARTVIASCENGTYSGVGWTTYHYSGGNDYIDYYEYVQRRGGSQSDVGIQQMRDINNDFDRILHSWNRSNLASGRIYTFNPAGSPAVPGSYRTYTRFHFIFDRPYTDPTCQAQTERW